MAGDAEFYAKASTLPIVQNAGNALLGMATRFGKIKPTETAPATPATPPVGRLVANPRATLVARKSTILSS